MCCSYSKIVLQPIVVPPGEYRLNQSQSHIATDGQSVSLGVELHLGPMARY
jgi:hypothetical protein